MSVRADGVVSVVVPVHNGERYLAAALSSVLEQVRPGDEVVVVDDGSTDASAAVAEGFAPRVRVVRQAASGAAAARNRGVAATGGAYVAFLDADDLAAAGGLEVLRERLQEPDCPDLVYGAQRRFRSPETVEPVGRLPEPVEEPPQALPGTTMIRRQAWEAVGGFREGLAAGEFVDWFARFTEAGLHAVAVPRVVLERRSHGGNLTATVDVRPAYLELVRRALERRRAKAGGGV